MRPEIAAEVWPVSFGCGQMAARPLSHRDDPRELRGGPDSRGRAAPGTPLRYRPASARVELSCSSAQSLRGLSIDRARVRRRCCD